MDRARRLFVVMARDAPVAVVFLHAPDGLVRMIRWNLNDDSFEAGQWFTGTVHDLCAHVSADGNYIIYSAERRKGEIPAWTAISKPPHFTALALWPHPAGRVAGGLFENDTTVWLNHSAAHMKLAQGFKLKPGVSALPRAGQGGELAFQEEVLQRCGWYRIGPSEAQPNRSGMLEKRSAPGVTLAMQILRVVEWNRRWHYRHAYQVTLPSGGVWTLPEDVTWADWDRNGDLLFAQRGALYRLTAECLARDERQGQMLANFRDMEFEAIKPSRSAQYWH